ncbi:MAG: Mur ligase domain-containing protein [Candidatus Saccharibacteria bacterium]|nr:Mur ligase domain-containing protein [Candidatus Saccharibacteria bacterium]
MHIYFSGIGGVGLGPLAEIALDAGYNVSGSDANDSPMFRQLRSRGAEVHLGQEVATINQLHANQPINWLVYTAALPENHPELEFARANGIKTSKRDELLAQIIKEKNLKLIAISGTHGKTTTTAMVVWLFHQLGLPVSYSIGSSITFGPSGAFDASSEYFVYECDEFDRNFLNFHPFISLIASQSYDHNDTYPTQSDYDEAFEQFKSQSQTIITWKEVSADGIKLLGEHNRSNGALAIAAIEKIIDEPHEKLVELLNKFPGTSRRFEKLANNLYSDYAHHPEEIEATLQLAHELFSSVVVVYQPHQNIRQHQITYGNCFDGAEKIYWLPTYLSREDPSLNILSPQELTKDLPGEKVVISNMGDVLKKSIETEIQNGKLVILMGAGQIDEWARNQFTSFSTN